MKVEDIIAIERSCEEFSIDAYKRAVSGNRENFVFSPYGAHSVLSMLAHGAGGITRLQMVKGLRLPDDDSIGLRGFKALNDELNDISRIELNVASKIFFSSEVIVKPEYVSLVENYFSSNCDNLDFTKSEESCKIINDWCSKVTKNHIDHIIDEGDLNVETTILLVNAIHFKARWKHVFWDYRTSLQIFHVTETETKDHFFMYQRQKLYFGELEDIDAKFVELPYVNERVRMIIIVPNKINGLPVIEKSLGKMNFERFSACRKKESVEVYLPRFEISSAVYLKDHLEQMGMVDMFSDTANFCKIADTSIHTVKVLQKTCIAVHDEGTTAAAYTYVRCRELCDEIRIFKTKSVPKIVRADRPFMMIISCDEMPLFYAKFTG